MSAKDRSSVGRGLSALGPLPLKRGVERGLRTGHLLALAGSAVVGASLWLPWYALRVPAALRGAISDQAGGLPAPLGDLARNLAQALPEKIKGTGWQTLHGPDVVLFCGALLVGLAVILAAGVAGSAVRVAPAAAGRLALFAGVGLGLLVIIKLMEPPGPNEYMSAEIGVWVALAGCALMAAGGLLASHPQEQAAEPEVHRPAWTPPAVDPARTSIAPPDR
jgi:hypothetical protein